MTATVSRLVWSVDGLRVPTTVKRPQRRSWGTTALSRAIREAHRAINDIEPPDLAPFGATLTPAQADQYRQWAERRRDRWTTSIQP